MGRALTASSCALTALLPLAAHAAHADSADTPGAARTVQRFTFEEPGNPLPVPAGWFRSQSDPAAGIDRPGFPVWNLAHLDTANPAFEGACSVRLPIDGGSAGLTLTPGVIPVFPSADYQVTAAVRTSGMKHARALLAARLLDQRGQPIPGAEFRSEPVHTAGAWQPVSVAVLGDAPDAAYLQVQLLALQPQQLHADQPPRPFQVWPEDFNAAAWFDDVTIVQEPRLDLAASDPANITLAPQRPELVARVRDLAREPLVVDIAVTDLDGRVVDRERRTLNGGRLEARWTPDLPAFGWYRAHLTLTADGVHVGDTRCDLLWLDGPPGGDPLAHAAPSSPDRRRFGLHAQGLPPSLRALLPGVVTAVGTGSVTLPLWAGDATDDADATLNQFVPLFESLQSRGQDVTIAIDRLPPALARDAGVDPAEAARLLGMHRALWAPALDPYLDRFGQRVRRWQIGRLGDEWSGGQLALHNQLAAAQDSFSDLVPGPILAIPWSSGVLLPAALASPNRAAIVHALPGPDGLAQLTREWLDAAAPHARTLDAPELALVLDAPDPAVHGRRGIAQLARRALAAWAEIAREPSHDRSQSHTPDLNPHARLVLASPWHITGARRPALQPSPALAAWRTLTDHLAGRSILADLEPEPGVRVLLLSARDANPNAGALVAWRTAEASPDAALELYMGEGDVHAVDLFGNRAPVARTTIGAGALPLHRLALTDEPVFLEGVDAGVVGFVTSARLDPALVPSSPGPHAHDLVLTNPWPFPLRGRLFILEPGGHSDPTTPADRSWDIAPRVADFAIEPGQQTRIPLALGFSAAQQSGPHDLVIDYELGAGRQGAIRTRGVFELGLASVRLDVYYRTQPSAARGAPPGARDVIVQAEVTNLTDHPIAVDVVAIAPDQPRTRVSITAVEPGRTAVRSLPFYAAADALRSQDIVVGLTLPDSEGRLNRSIKIAD